MWTAAALQTLLGHPWGQCEGEPSQWAELQAVHLVVHFAWKEKWTNMWLCINSWAVANGLNDGQGLGRKMTGKLVTRKYGEGYGQIVLWMGKKSWRYLCPMRMLTKRWPQQRSSLIIKWIRWPLLWVPVSFFPQRETLLSPRGPMNKVAMVAERRLDMGSTMWASAYRGWPSYSTTECLMC